MNKNIAIKVENLTKIYHLYDKPQDRLKEALNPFKKSYHNDFYAMNDVSFEIKKGETVGIIGKNGSGKSTLLKIITGVLTPTKGRVNVHGEVSAILELGSGFNPEMTGLENIYLNTSINGMSKKETDKKIDEIVEFSELGEFIHQPIKTYSSGMIARLAFAVSINIDPDILIIDEALSVGDVAFQFKCFKKFQDFQKSGKTILFVSHSSQQIIQYCNRAIFLHNGKIESVSDNVKQIINEYETKIRTAKEVKPNKIEKEQKNEKRNLTFDTSPNKNINEHRFGSHEAIFSKVVISHNKDSFKSDSILTAGKKTYLSFYVMSKNEFPAVVIGTSLKNKDGISIWGNNTLEHTLKLKKGVNKITMEFDINITAGEYLLFSGLADISKNPRIELDQRWPCDVVKIVSKNRKIEGYVFSDMTLHID